MQIKKKYLLVALVFLFINLFTSLNSLNAQEDKFIVVLDAGHGGRDPGAISNGVKEKDIALKVVLEVGKALEGYKGIKIIYTRKKDIFIPLHKRASIANKADADLFISIHCNAVKNSRPYGTETWVLGEKNTDRNFEFAKRENEVIFLEDNYEENYEGFNPSSPESTIAISIEQEIYIEQSIALARKIENNFINKVKRKSRGLKQGSLLVIRNTYMPSILVELGFLTNKKEVAFLNTKRGQTKMAQAIKDAIVDYKNELDLNVGKHLVDNDNSEETSNEQIFNGVTFKVQIAASSRDLATKPYNFKGLNSISKSEIGKLYKYYYGSTSNYTKIKEQLLVAKNKGYSTSYIVAFKDGKQITLSEVLKDVSN